MQRERVTRRSHAAMVVGWISTAEGLLLGLLLMFAVTLFVTTRVQSSETKNHQMLRDIAKLQGQRGQADGLVAGLQAERDRLINLGRRMINNLRSELTSLQTKYTQLMAATEEAAEKSRSLEADNQKLKARVDAYRAYCLTLKRSLEQTTAEKQETAIRLASATEERDIARQESRVLREAEPGLHRELVGLKGKMQRVAIIFDTSGSMGTDGRWEHARDVVRTWLEHLAIGECVLVLFSDDARVFPEDGTFLDVRGPAGDANRKRLLDKIRHTKPEGRTNTLLALQMAYRYANLDTIILFTDGEPNSPSSSSDKFDPEVAERIYALCRQHQNIPINTVGLGNYFRPQLSSFLMKVAQDTDGSFLGR